MGDLQNLSTEEKQALLASIVDSSEDAIISKNLEGVVTTWNYAAERLFGYQEQEAVGSHISFLIPSNRLSEEDFIIREIKHGRRIDHFQTIRKAKSGTDIPVSISISPVKNEYGLVIGASKIARDIRSQLKATEKQHVLAAIIDNSEDAIISKTLDGIITSWNHAAERMFGYSEGEAVGQHISLIIPEERIGEEAFIIARIRQGENVKHFETIRQSKKGEHIPISLTISPILDDQKKIIGASKIARDITDTLNSRKEREALYQEIEVLSRKKDDFIAMTTHELKTPITSLSAFLQVLAMQEIPLEDQQKFVSRCARQVDKLMVLINDLLNFTRIQSGKLELRYETVDLINMLNEVLAGLTQFTTHSITVNSPDYLGIYADPFRIEQVLTNFIGNAIKYSPLNTPIEIFISETENDIRVEVADAGIGIKEQFISELFTQFYRAVETNHHIQGLGMGLYISKEIIERHGGTVGVESKQGEGSMFWFQLPKKRHL